MTDHIASIILAGGKARRLGRNKLSAVVGDRMLLQRVIDSLTLVSEHILIVTAKEQRIDLPDAMGANLTLVSDIYSGKGALGGIHAGLLASDCRYNLAVAADMPFLNPELLRYLVSVSPGFDVIMPRIHGNIEPLHAVYSRDCLTAIQEKIEQNVLEIRSFLSRMKVRYVEEAEIDRFDPRHLSFFNINTPAELERARMIAVETDKY